MPVNLTKSVSTEGKPVNRALALIASRPMLAQAESRPLPGLPPPLPPPPVVKVRVRPVVKGEAKPDLAKDSKVSKGKVRDKDNQPVKVKALALVKIKGLETKVKGRAKDSKVKDRDKTR